MVLRQLELLAKEQGLGWGVLGLMLGSLILLPLLAFLCCSTRTDNELQTQLQLFLHVNDYKNKLGRRLALLELLGKIVYVLLLMQVLGYGGACAAGYFRKDLLYLRGMALGKPGLVGGTLVFLVLLSVHFLVGSLLVYRRREYEEISQKEKSLVDVFLKELEPVLVDKLRFGMEQTRREEFCKQKCAKSLKQLLADNDIVKARAKNITKFEWCPRCYGIAEQKQQPKQRPSDERKRSVGEEDELTLQLAALDKRVSRLRQQNASWCAHECGRRFILHLRNA